METGYTTKAAIARVQRVAGDGRHVYLEYRNGFVAVIEVDEAFSLDVGDVVFVGETELETAPADLWVTPTFVATVRAVLSDATVIERNGTLFTIPHSEEEHAEGNTVEADEVRGVIRVLAEKPLQWIEGGAGDSLEIDRFKSTPAQLAGETFDDFGGYRHVADRAHELIELPLERHDELAAIGARPIKGVLFWGPPGTGKTKLARIIAGRAKAAFYYINGPEIFAPLVGQSEELLRKIFADAAEQARAIIFFDELDSLAADRDSHTHESSRRIVAMLLTLMDGFDRNDNVIIIGATNRPQDIDPALRRPGRLDWEIAFELPDPADREDILAKSARPLSTEGPLPHAMIAKRTSGWSPAELAAIWNEAARFAADEGRTSILAEDYFAGFRRVDEQRRLSTTARVGARR